MSLSDFRADTVNGVPIPKRVTDQFVAYRSDNTGRVNIVLGFMPLNILSLVREDGIEFSEIEINYNNPIYPQNYEFSCNYGNNVLDKNNFLIGYITLSDENVGLTFTVTFDHVGSVMGLKTIYDAITASNEGIELYYGDNNRGIDFKFRVIKTTDIIISGKGEDGQNGADGTWAYDIFFPENHHYYYPGSGGFGSPGQTIDSKILKIEPGYYHCKFATERYRAGSGGSMPDIYFQSGSLDIRGGKGGIGGLNGRIICIYKMDQSFTNIQQTIYKIWGGVGGGGGGGGGYNIDFLDQDHSGYTTANGGGTGYFDQNGTDGGNSVVSRYITSKHYFNGTIYGGHGIYSTPDVNLSGSPSTGQIGDKKYIGNGASANSGISFPSSVSSIDSRASVTCWVRINATQQNAMNIIKL